MWDNTRRGFRFKPLPADAGSTTTSWGRILGSKACPSCRGGELLGLVVVVVADQGEDASVEYDPDVCRLCDDLLDLLDLLSVAPGGVAGRQ